MYVITAHAQVYNACLTLITAVGAFADFVLALWPVSIAWNLQTTRRVKVMFCALMGVGMLPAIVSGYRVTHIPAPSTSKDITRKSI